MELNLTERELRLLAGVLQNHLPAMREEIGGTENYEWRQSMKQDEETLRSLLMRIEALITVPQAS